MKKFKMSLGEKVDTFLKENTILRWFLKFSIVSTLTYWTLGGIMVLKNVEQSDKLFVLLSISWIIALKFITIFVVLYYDMPKAKKTNSDEKKENIKEQKAINFPIAS